jgi:sigma-B regulation protein RsbU (phosphoserine phosphatase)
MAELKGVIQALAPHHTSPKKILTEIIGFLKNHFEADTFVTMVYGILHPSKKQLTVVRAGHPPVGLVRQKNVSWVEPKGVGLGMTPDQLFAKSLQEKALHLKKGDIVFFYTDGLSEARNSGGDEYGEEVLTHTLLDLHGQGAQEILAEIRKRLDKFTRGEPRHDDVTLVAMRLLK